MKLLYALVFVAFTQAQSLPPVWQAADYAHLNKRIVAPRLEHPFDPDYTPQAREAGIEGAVVLEAIIDKGGRVTHASVLSPLPCGLEVKALQALARWRYAAATMDGELVPVLTTVDVVFKLPYVPGDYKQERARARDFAHALFVQGKLAEAAFYGSSDAQRKIAGQFESDGKRGEAQWYYRMCAATGHADCEYELGKLLVNGSAINPNTFAQGVAWLELAKDHGNQSAAQAFAKYYGELSSPQINWVADLKPRLEFRTFQGF